jgi:hypothetical protein
LGDGAARQSARVLCARPARLDVSRHPEENEQREASPLSQS